VGEHLQQPILLACYKSYSIQEDSPDLQIYLQPRVTLTFDLLTPKVDRFMRTTCATWHHNWFIHFQNTMFSFVTDDEEMDRQTDKQTQRQTNKRTGREHHAFIWQSCLVDVQKLHSRCSISFVTFVARGNKINSHKDIHQTDVQQCTKSG